MIILMYVAVRNLGMMLVIFNNRLLRIVIKSILLGFLSMDIKR